MTTNRIAMFTHNTNDNSYLPANKAAVAACAVMSKMRLAHGDMVVLRSKGFDTMLTNGKPIGEVDVKV